MIATRVAAASAWFKTTSAAPPRLHPSGRAFHVFSTDQWLTWVEVEPGLFQMIEVDAERAAEPRG
jgi:hypothetical protein